jgi:hypothetical protein
MAGRLASAAAIALAVPAALLLLVHRPSAGDHRLTHRIAWIGLAGLWRRLGRLEATA